MNVGDVWSDIDGNKYEVVDIVIDENEDGSIITNVTSRRIS